jgi:hypothetical protein
MSQMSGVDPHSLIGIRQRLAGLRTSGWIVHKKVKRYAFHVAKAESELRVAKANAMSEACARQPKYGTVGERDEAIVLKVETKQKQLDRAKIRLQYAKDIVRERESERSSLQTEAKLIVEEMRLSGFGGGA